MMPPSSMNDDDRHWTALQCAAAVGSSNNLYGVFMFNVLPSSPLLFALEPFQAMCDYIAGHTHLRDLSPKGDGHPILIYPGLTLSGSSTADLRVRLQQLGYAVYDWRQGYNYGPGIDFDGWLSLLSEQLLEIHAHHQCSVSLVGCSLGGTYARELAKLHPRLVRQVITLATPFVKPDVIAAEKMFGRLTGTRFLIDEALLQRLSEEPPVPCSSIYSQTDGIVNWRSCVGKDAPGCLNIEVEGVSHLGMSHHPKVLGVVARLLQPPTPPNTTAGSAVS
jgi:hypothetical protein